MPYESPSLLTMCWMPGLAALLMAFGHSALLFLGGSSHSLGVTQPFTGRAKLDSEGAASSRTTHVGHASVSRRNIKRWKIIPPSGLSILRLQFQQYKTPNQALPSSYHYKSLLNSETTHHYPLPSEPNT